MEEFEKRLSDVGYQVGLRLLELLNYREKVHSAQLLGNKHAVHNVQHLSLSADTPISHQLLRTLLYFDLL